MRLPHVLVSTVLGLAASAGAVRAQERPAEARPAETRPAGTPRADQLAPAAYEVDFRFLTTPPRGMPPMPLPDGAPPTRERFELGRALFAEPLLSADRTEIGRAHV